jgi:predicted class III extradiol MEMO1 family dioxygenase
MRDVRPAAVAGTFYPRNAAELAVAVRECLAEPRRRWRLPQAPRH